MKKQADWTPVDGFDLEKAALEAVKSDQNLLITAGPGSGKTERSPLKELLFSWRQILAFTQGEFRQRSFQKGTLPVKSPRTGHFKVRTCAR